MLCSLLVQVAADLDWLASISQFVNLIKDDAVVLIALSHVCACCQVDVLPKLFQDDLCNPSNSSQKFAVAFL